MAAAVRWHYMGGSGKGGGHTGQYRQKQVALEKRTNINPNALPYIGDNEVINKDGVLLDKDGRYWVAVGPMVMNPDYDPKRRITPEDMQYGTKIDVIFEDTNAEGNGSRKYILPCVVGEVKAHTSPGGIVQTGVAFPGGKNVTYEEGREDVSIIEFCGTTPKTPEGKEAGTEGFGRYSIVSIRVYEE